MKTANKLPPCPKIALCATNYPYQAGLLATEGDTSALTLLYSGAMRSSLVSYAATAGTRAARRNWYALRRRVLSLMRIAARDGCSVVWGQPAASEHLHMWVYLVRDGRVAGEGDIGWIGRRVDVVYRGMIGMRTAHRLVDVPATQRVERYMQRTTRANNEI